MKTDREKLIELVHEALEKCNTTPCSECEYIELNNGCCDLCFEHLAADYFIEHGMTIPVRCKDCKWGHTYERWDGDEGAECGKYGAYKMANSFCSYGERKEE